MTAGASLIPRIADFATVEFSCLAELRHTDSCTADDFVWWCVTESS